MSYRGVTIALSELPSQPFIAVAGYQILKGFKAHFGAEAVLALRPAGRFHSRKNALGGFSLQPDELVGHELERFLSIVKSRPRGANMLLNKFTGSLKVPGGFMNIYKGACEITETNSVRVKDTPDLVEMFMREALQQCSYLDPQNAISHGTPGHTTEPGRIINLRGNMKKRASLIAKAASIISWRSRSTETGAYDEQDEESEERNITPACTRRTRPRPRPRRKSPSPDFSHEAEISALPRRRAPQTRPSAEIPSSTPKPRADPKARAQSLTDDKFTASQYLNYNRDSLRSGCTPLGIY